MKEKLQDIDIKYTICFCTVSEQARVLMVLRANSPNKGKLNGLGGKIKDGENHKAAIMREMLEEADIDISKADSLNYVGVVTWKSKRGDVDHLGGMYAYIANYADPSVMFEKRETREGVLDWYPIDDIIREDNTDVVENIIHFLPPMLEGKVAHYHCTYIDDDLVNFEVLPLE